MKRVMRRMFFATFMLLALMSQLVFAAPKLGKKSLTISVGKTATLKLKGAAGKSVKWKSSNAKVVSISSSTNAQAVLSAKKAGSAKVTATVGKTKLTCSVSVKGAAASSSDKIPANRKVVYTGEPGKDYVYEVMMNEAGIKLTMSDEEIVKRVYEYMTKRFAPVNDSDVRPVLTKKGYKRTRFFKAEKLKDQMKEFFRKTEEKRKRGDITYMNPNYVRPYGEEAIAQHNAQMAENAANNASSYAGTSSRSYSGYWDDEYDDENDEYNDENDRYDEREESQPTQPETEEFVPYDPFSDDYLWKIPDYLEHFWGDCISASTIFAEFCKHCGVTAGWSHGLADKTSNHYWSWAKINGKKWYFDLWLSGGWYFKTKPHKLDYRWYKIPKSQAKKLYIFKEEFEEWARNDFWW